MKNLNSMADDYNTSQSNLVSEQPAASAAAAAGSLNREAPIRSSSSRQQLVVDEMSQDLTYLSREAPLDGGESTFGAANSYSQLAGAGREDSVLHMGSELPDELASGRAASSASRQLGSGPAQFSYSHNELALDQLSPDNIDIQRPLQQAGQSECEPAAKAGADSRPEMPLKPFLVSFMVDARGGAMRGCRHSGVRVIIPPNSAQMPMRITCRYLRRERLVHPPPLMEGEACASKIMEVGPAGAKFLGPVLIEVPHFASLRGKEREIIILRSDSGEVWREHLVESDERLIEQIIRSARSNDSTDDQFSDQENRSGVGGNQSDGEGGEKRRLTRILTNEFPQYFAIISRIRQEVHAVGPEGSTINSQVVPRVQAIFTEGALTKRIKIGLQGNKKQQAQDHQSAEQSAANRADSPAANQQDSLTGEHQLDSLDSTDRAVSPHSNQGSQTPRPGSSAANKRPRSRFLACFGAGHGSVDLLNSTDDSSAGGESPRQPCNEKLVKQRHILGDVSDSEGDLSSEQLSDSNRNRRVKRHVQRQELVPQDYYIEREQPLILNEEPKTYGKRLKSSSAQTDSKLNATGYMSTSTKKSSKKRGLLPGKRKNKTQLNIVCDSAAPAPVAGRKSASGEQAADSSLDTLEQQNLELERKQQDEISLIRDVVTSDDHKWRTCTIQTDSDSVTVNYVMASSAPPEAAGSAPNSAQDDGYASGSGDFNRQSSFGKGLFGLSAFGGSSDKHTDEAKRGRKQRAKKAKKEKSKEKGGKKSGQLKQPQVDEVPEEQLELRAIKTESPEPSAATAEKLAGNQTDDEQQVVSTTADLSLAEDSIGRSVSPSGKELKLKLKLEKREKEKREKEEKRLLKEQEEAAEKLKKKQDKEAKEAEKLAKKAEKQAQKLAKKSPPSSKPQTPLPGETLPAGSSTSGVKTTSVKFASTLVESSAASEPVKHDSLQPSDLSLSSDFTPKEQHDMVRVSISEKLVEQAPGSLELSQQPVASLESSDRMISFSESEEPSKSLELDESLRQLSFKSNEQTIHQTDLKPILKQQSTISSGEEVGSELVIDEKRDLASVASKLVSEATEKAVREADRLKREAKEDLSPDSSSSLSKKELDKLEKERLSKEAKAKAELEKRLAKEAKLAKKTEQAEAKKAAKAAKAEQERLAKEAKAEQDRLAKEAKAEQERLAKEAKAEQERLAKEAKAERERLAKEAKLKLKLEKESKKKSKDKKALPSAPPADEAAEVEPSSESQATESKLTADSSQAPKFQVLEEIKSELKSELESTIDAPETSSKKDPSSLTAESSSKKKEKKSKSKKKKSKEAKVKVTKEKRARKSSSSSSSSSESEAPATEAAEDQSKKSKSSASKSSFFGRLFKRRPKVPKTDDADKSLDSAKAAEAQDTASGSKKGSKPMILSEMYPSDPDDAESEMILEVNVPKNLIGSQQQHHVTKRQLSAEKADFSQASDGPTSPTLGTTIDESFVTTDDHGLVPAPEKWSSVEHQQQQVVADPDDQATLVNVSQMVASDLDDDDATENVVSQSIELVHTNIDTADPTSRSKRSIGELSPGEVVEPIVEKTRESITERAIVTEPQLVDARQDAPVEKEPEAASSSAGEPKKTKKSKTELKKEMDLKELEVKLEKEAKKRAEEEEKLRKKEAKEEEKRLKVEKKQAEVEAKRLAKEAKVKAKEETQEAKRLAKLAEKERKKEKKGKKKVVASAETSVTVLTPNPIVSSGDKAAATEAEVLQPSSSGEAQVKEAEVELDLTGNMTPVNTETEVQRIVEEVVDAEGVVTRTTRTVETKYVTLRQEELRLGDVRKMPLDEYERLVGQEGEQQARVSVQPADLAAGVSGSGEQQTSSRRLVHIELKPYENEELNAIRATPSYFSADQRPVELEGVELSPKKELKKRIKLNQRLIKRAHKLAKSEAKKAKRDARLAGNEIATCDEAAKQARKELKRALKQAKKAAKLAAKQHKKMDKVDKKLAKRQNKIDKRQQKLDKLAAKAAAKEAKRLAKEAKKAGKLSKQNSGSRKSIKLEDIGVPVLHSSSRLSLGQGSTGEQQQRLQAGSSSGEMVTLSKTVIERASPTSDDIQVEMSLEQALPQGADAELLHTITTETIVQHPDGQVTTQVSERHLTGDEARQAAQRLIERDTKARLGGGSAESEDEEIDVVSDLPTIPAKREPELAD